MKRLILFELIILFLATTFESDSPPGWFQQTLPVNKIINDIFFIDSSNGWAVTAGGSNISDTAFILNTTNGGTNWLVQKTGIENFTTIQFVDQNIGYAYCKQFNSIYLTIYKTTNSGNSWQLLNNIVGFGPSDIFFVNPDTGWASDYINGGAGLQKTTNGGLNWSQQLSGSFGPSKLFFINKDTGWAACQNTNLYRTTNGGGVWTLQFTFSPFDNDIRSIFFINNNTGYTTNYSTVDTNGIYITTNGGFNWIKQRDVDPFGSGLGEVFFNNSNTGYIATGFSKIIKTTNSGLSWYKQSGPNGAYGSVQFVDSNSGWAGGTILIHTLDGGGPPVGIQQITSEIPSEYKLYQNYPNPFNPSTNIKYSVKSRQGGTSSQTSNVKLIVFDITGKEVTKLVNQVQSAGIYLADWNATGYASGVYFYSLIIDGKAIDTRRMVLVK